MAAQQYTISSDLRENKPILPRTLRRHENGWDSTMFNTNLVAFHVPSERPPHWVHVPVIHFNVDDGKTMVLWRQFWEDRAETAFVTLPNGRKYLVVTPYDCTPYQNSEHMEYGVSVSWRGEMLVFACGVHNGLLVNMRTWQEERRRAWEVVRRFLAGDVDGLTVESDWEARSLASEADSTTLVELEGDSYYPSSEHGEDGYVNNT
ncbi:unnamed protein product [Peniophora sp. CBMAI 1063]|nr:unnamed protein product [Peniophora sp. CBMAI 1063]